MCEKEEVPLYQKTVLHKNFLYLINDEDKTASVIQYQRPRKYIIDEVIPRSINFDSTEYIVTSISKYAFKNDSMLSLTFAPDSEVRLIKPKAFKKFSVKKVSLPSTLEELSDDWCTNNQYITNVEINNSNYISHEGKFIFGKLSKDQENFNVFIFCAKDVEEVTIPNFIEIIKEHAFDGCTKLRKINFESGSQLRIIEKNAFQKTEIESITIPPHLTQIESGTFSKCSKLKKIEFSENSELRVIQKNAFSESSIEFISMPQNLIELEDGWCSQTPKLNKIQINPLNKNYKFIDDVKIIIGKSSIEEENFDLLVFCCRDVKEVTIPNSITKIKPFSFSDSSIEKVSFSPNVKEICSKAFSHCEHIQKVEFPENSQIQLINENAFEESSINEIHIPSSLTNLKKGWCSLASKLTKITISPSNPCYKVDDSGVIFGKSSIEQKNFDVLVFAPRDIKEIAIPSFIEIIDAFSFSHCSQLQNVKILNDSKLRIIENNAFYNCAQLKNIEIPFDSKIEIIGEFSFAQTSIENFTLPSSVKKICRYAFFNCNKLQNFEIHEDSQLENINEFAFSKTSIKRIFIPKHTVEISNNSFDSCKELKIVDISKNSELKTIGDSSFAYSMIEQIKLPIHLQTIGKNAFQLCNNLKIVDIPNESELRVINSGTFQCSSIESILIPSHVTQICNYAFENCFKLKNVIIPKNSELLSIGSDAFCHSIIENISIPSKLKVIDSSAFHDCPLKQIEIPNDSELKIIGSSAFSMSCIESFLIPNQVEFIDSFAFSYCRNLKRISLSSALRLIQFDGSIFYWCCDLDHIDINPNNPYYKIHEGNMLIGKSTDKQDNFDVLIKFFGNSESVKIPSFIEIIFPYAFQGNSNIKRIEFPSDSKLRVISESAFHESSIEIITIPSNVRQIESYAFFRAWELSTVIIKSDSKLESIGEFSFSSTKIKTITIPSHLTKIEKKAFEARDLKEVNFLPNSNLLTIEEKAFARTQIESFTVPTKLNKIEISAFKRCEYLKTFIIPENSSPITIKPCIFKYSSIKNFSILNTELNDLQNGWCCDCKYLTNIKVNQNNPYLKMYEKNLLIGKSSKDKENFDVLHFCLRNAKFNIIIPNYIEIINNCAFTFCKNIQSIVFEPNSKTRKICYEAFFLNTNLKKVVIPENSELQEIEGRAFLNTNVQSFYFPRKIKKIGKDIFSKNNIKIIEFADNPDLEFNELKFCKDFNNLIIMMPLKMSERLFKNKTFD